MAWLGGGHGLWRTKEALQRRCAGPGVELALVPLMDGTGGPLRPGGEWVGASGGLWGYTLRAGGIRSAAPVGGGVRLRGGARGC